MVAEKVVWFQYESVDSLNSNVFEVAQKLVQQHFPGRFNYNMNEILPIFHFLTCMLKGCYIGRVYMLGAAVFTLMFVGEH